MPATTPSAGPAAAERLPADPSVQLWDRLARPFRPTETVDALFGLAPDAVAQLAGTMLCTSPEAVRLLHAMPALVRALTTSSEGAPVRSQGQIRGPVLWSETMSARAASFGDPDLFVCSTPQRDYDTAENRVLVQALLRLVDGGKAIDRMGPQHDDESLRAARSNARTARLFLDHPALTRVSRDRVTARTLKRARGSKAGPRYRPAIELLERASEPLEARDLLPYRDRRTGLQHEILLAVIEELERRGMRIPPLRVEGGALLAGPVTYVHPRRLGARDRVHGILVGDVLIDVPERLRDVRPEREQETLEARAHGRLAAVLTDRSQVAAAVDLAVRDARQRVAHRGPVPGV